MGGAGRPVENPPVFYPRRLWEVTRTYGPFVADTLHLWLLCKRIKRDPATARYMNLVLTPVEDAKDEHLEMFEHSDAAPANAKAKSAKHVAAAE